MALTLTELLAKLRELDVELSTDGERLQCNAPRGVLTPDLRAEIARLKPELLEFLKGMQQTLQAGNRPLRAVPRHAPLPASFGQQRLWFLQELEPGNYAYNLAGAVRVHGPLQVPILEQTLTAIAARHETLRTTFRYVDGALFQQIGEASQVPLDFLDLSALTGDVQDERVQEYLRTETRRPFNLLTGPHWRVALLQLGVESHVLMIVQHHIISDGWSLGLFVREMGLLYEAFLAGAPSPFPPLPIQYADYAYWQHHALREDGLAAQLAYWKSQLRPPLPVLDLPADRPRPLLQTQNGDCYIVTLPAALSAKIRELSSSEGATLFMMLLAAFKVLLYRYTGQTDLIVGTSNGIRTHVETESLIGYFVNTLAIRTDLSDRPTFRELLGRVRSTALQAYEHLDLPFERLVEELRPVRDLSRTPLFQVMFILQNAPTQNLELQSLTLSGMECGTGTSKFDMTLSVTDSRPELAAILEYSTDLFDAATVRRLLAHWRAILEHVVLHPATRVSEIPLLSNDERQRLLCEWNETAVPISDGATLCDLFARRVELAPERVALVSGPLRLTYGELQTQSARLARTLRRAGVGRGSLVGICVDRSPQLVIGLLGILQAGAAYVPLDSELPRQRTQLTLSDSQPSVVLVDSQSHGQLPEGPFLCINLEDLPAAEEIAGDDTVWPHPADPAYLIYTSGSTGKPNGTLISHRSVVNVLEDLRREPGIQADDVLLAVTPVTFDISVLELFLPLIAGARVVIADRATARDPLRLGRALTDAGVTVMQATPATWRMLIESGWQGAPELRAFCGGEDLPRDLADRLLVRCQMLWNLYGPTETTIWSTRHRVVPGETPVPIGRPIANTRIYLLDDEMQPVPVGVRGEIYIGGAGLAYGYPHRPGLTAERFVPDPFASPAGSRLYRTGDCGRFLPGGRIEFIGRLDFQVKVRGVRVELGEVAFVLRSHPAVSNAVVTATRNHRHEQVLAAYVVLRNGMQATISEFRSLLEEHLPPQMHPAAFIFLDDLPLTPAGKLDRRRLPAPEQDRVASSRSAKPPRNPTEELIHQFWTQILPAQEPHVVPGIDDNFFDLGGHSLLLVQLQKLLTDAFPIEISIIDLFRLPTIAATADFIGTRIGPRDGGLATS